MKVKLVLIFTILFFLILTTHYYWVVWAGIWAIPLFIGMVVYFIVLCVCLLYQIFLFIEEKDKNRTRIYLIGIMVLVIGLTIYKPFGIIDYDKIEGSDLVKATSEGAGGCNMTFQLKEKNVFKITTVCFGMDRSWGTYIMRNDTILLSGSDKYKYGILKSKASHHGDLRYFLELYGIQNDTIPYTMSVVERKL